MTETIQLHEIDELELRALLSNLKEIYYNRKSFFEGGITPIFKNFGEIDNLVIGVHIFSQKNGGLIYIILSEYEKDTRVATLNVSSVLTAGLFSPSANKKGEIKIRELLEQITYEELESYSKQEFHQQSDELFICPSCSAQYFMRVLHVAEDDRIECQNCGELFDPIELEAQKWTASHDS